MLSPRAKTTAEKAAAALLLRLYPNMMSGIAPESLAPVAGDLICALKGCPAFVFLHKVQGSDKYKITGKYRRYQPLALQYCLKDVVLCTQTSFPRGKIYNHRWSFRNMEMVGGLPQESFTVV